MISLIERYEINIYLRRKMYSPMSELLPLNQARALHSLQSIAQLAGPLVVLSIYFIMSREQHLQTIRENKDKKI